MNQNRATLNEYELSFNEKRKKYKYEFKLDEERNKIDRYVNMGNEGENEFTNMDISKMN